MQLPNRVRITSHPDIVFHLVQHRREDSMKPFLPFLVLLIGLLSPGMLFASADSSLCFASLGSYWRGFIKWWVELFKSQNGVVMIALGVGVVSLFIITRGKWKK
jgi:hypothetical protein